MKSKLLYQLLFCLIYAINYAQPTLQPNDVQTNLTSTLYTKEAEGFVPGGSGPNQTWDFSGFQFTINATFNSVPVATGIQHTTFPESNNCYKFSPSAFNINFYYYMKVSNSEMDQLGIASDDDVYINYNGNTRKMLQFPYTYNTTYTDSYQELEDDAPTNMTVTYDAYGTLILPFGTFTNVIRQKIEENGVTNYKWINTNPFYYIVETYFETDLITITKATSVLAVDQSSINTFTLAPNPTNGEFKINSSNFTNDHFSIMIYDSTGRLVLKKEVSSDSEIAITDCAAGLYYAKILDENNNLLCSKKIIKY